MNGEEKSATTVLVNDGNTVVSQMKNFIRPPEGLLSSASTSTPQDLKTFLAKPYPLVEGTLSSTDTTATFSAVEIFSTLMALPIYKQKVNGHMGIRATVVLRLQVNAERFMQGRYILALEPFVTAASNANGYQHSSEKDLQFLNSKTTITQLPHVQFDLNCDTEATLRIPYVSPYSHYSMPTGHGDVGSFRVYPYCPLTTGSTGSTTCQYIIWSSLEDVELVAPTLPQGDFEFQSNMRPVGRVKKRGTVTEKEQEEGGIGPISSVLNKVSRAADIVAQIPVISLVATQVGWAADIAARAASVFGWSKPVALAAPMRMKDAWAPFWNNPDAADFSYPLAVMATNSIETLPGFAGSNDDEMSIDYIKTIPAYFSSATWTTSQVVGTNLFNLPMMPRAYSSSANDSKQNYRVQTPMAFLANLFADYRGSIRLTFKFVKTEFHSGRLALSYAPCMATPTTTFSLGDSTYLLREIIDLRLGNEFSFVIPYASVTPYKSGTDPYGYVQLDVVNELVAPASVNSAVTILLEVSAAPDMEFANYNPKGMTPYVPVHAQGDFEFQGDMDMGKDECSLQEGILANAAMFDDHLAGSRYCVGEKIMSLLQLVKRSSWWFNGNDTGQQTCVTYPFSLSASQSTANGVYTDEFTADTVSIICSLYAMSRGGMRLKVTDRNFCLGRTQLERVTVGLSVPKCVNFSTGTSGVQDSSTYFGNCLGTVFNGETPLEIQVPQYSIVPTRINQELMTGLYAPTNSSSATYPKVCVYTEFYSTPFWVTYRSVSDDFQCGYFTGVPPMIFVGDN